MKKISTNILLFVFSFMLLGFSKAEALVVFSEGVSGDLSFNNLQSFNFILGSNEIIGSVSEPGDIFDPFAFNISSGQQLDSIKLVNFSGPSIALTLFAAPDASSNSIGGLLFDSTQIGTDLLFPSTGSSSLSSGAYSARFFTASSTESQYRLNFQVGEAIPDGESNTVPEPATMFLLGAGLLGASLRHRRY